MIMAMRNIIMTRARAEILSSRFPLSMTSIINSPKKVLSMKSSTSGLLEDGLLIVMIFSTMIFLTNIQLISGSRITVSCKTSFFSSLFRPFLIIIAVISALIKMALPVELEPVRTESSSINLIRVMPSSALVSWIISSFSVSALGSQAFLS